MFSDLSGFSPRKTWLTAPLLAFAAVSFASVLPAAIFADSKPEPRGMSDDELAHLVNLAALARQDPDDWTGWDAEDQEAMTAYRYQIAFMSYALSLQQYHSVPAWRELHHELQNRLLERMIRKPVWEYWAEVSKSRRDYDPDFVAPEPSQHDPVGKQNIMYSGHIVHMAALHEMMYRDDKWSRPGAITFRWDDQESYSYDLQSLLKVIHAEMMQPRSAGGCIAGVECEPNLIFPECNQHPLLAFQLNDHNRGTSFYAPAVERLGGFFDCTQMYDPKTQSVANSYRVKQAKLMRLPNMPSPSADGWTGAFMVAWQPATVRAAYENQKKINFRRGADGKIEKLAFDPMFELGLGFFALLATELGDEAMARELFEFADANYGPVRENGALRYPHRYKGQKIKVSSTHDKVIAMARSNRIGGLTALHHAPWKDEDFAHPLIEGIDFPRVLVSEARWVKDRNTLVIELRPGPAAPEAAAFRVRGVNPTGTWTLTRDGDEIGACGPDGVTSGAVSKNPAPDTIEITVPLASPARLELRQIN